jgi:trimeric autotransporter adhesin
MSQAGIFSFSLLPPGSVVETIQGNTGGPVGPNGANNIHVVGDGTTITIAGNPGTNTLTASVIEGSTTIILDGDIGSITGHELTFDANTQAGSSVVFSAAGTTMSLLVTDDDNNTIVGLNAGNPSLTGSNNTAFGEGTGIDLTSGSNNIFLGTDAGSSVTTGNNNVLIGHDGFTTSTNLIVIARGSGGVPFFHNYPGSNSTTTNGGNLFIGTGAGNFTLNGGPGNASNNGIGAGTFEGLTTGARNNAFGSFALTDLTTGTNNIVIGHSAGSELISGTFNVLVGYDAGNAYTTSESSNILIGNDGVITENNTIRLGTNGSGDNQQNRCFIAGIDGVNVGSTATVVTEAGDQLGTAVISGGAGITVTTGANSIVISGSGSITFTYTNVNTSPYVVLITDDYISVDSSGGPITIQMPNAATLGKIYVVKDRTGSAAIHNITVTTVGGVINIDGAATFVMNTAYQSVSLIGNNSSYEIY